MPAHQVLTLKCNPSPLYELPGPWPGLVSTPSHGRAAAIHLVDSWETVARAFTLNLDWVVKMLMMNLEMVGCTDVSKAMEHFNKF